MARTKIKKGALTFKMYDGLLGLLLCYLLPRNELPDVLARKAELHLQHCTSQLDILKH